MPSDRAYEPLTCPMPECDQYLNLIFETSASLYLGTLDDGEPLSPADSDLGTWRVECVSGHVILVPTDPGCICEEDCGCDVDRNEEMRTFRASDVDQLRTMVNRLNVARTLRRTAVAATAPWELLDHEHGDHDEYVRRARRCLDGECPRHRLADSAP